MYIFVLFKHKSIHLIRYVIFCKHEKYKILLNITRYITIIYFISDLKKSNVNFKKKIQKKINV